jgi:hypothetical protein
MAQNLQQRLEAAKSPRARIADNEALIADLKAEQERLEAARDQASAESVDFALSDADRDEAAAKAARLDRTIKSLGIEIAAVAALTEERRSDDARKAAEAEKRAALTERDEIAAQFAERVPLLTAELIDLFKAVEANEARMRAAGVHDANAEWHARGIAGNGLVGGISPAMPFTKLKIPEFRGAGRAWPVDHLSAISAQMADNYGQQIRKARENAERAEREKAEAAAKFAREHGTYRLTADMDVSEPGRIVRLPAELVTGNIPAALGCWDSRQLVIAHKVAEQLSKVPHLKVERLDAEASR